MRYSKQALGMTAGGVTLACVGLIFRLGNTESAKGRIPIVSISRPAKPAMPEEA